MWKKAVSVPKCVLYNQTVIHVVIEIVLQLSPKNDFIPLHVMETEKTSKNFLGRFSSHICDAGISLV